jgi:hypothetical protein
MKQPDPEILLKGMDLMTDCGWGDVQLVSGLAEAHMPGRGLKRTQGAQGRQRDVHIR